MADLNDIAKLLERQLGELQSIRRSSHTGHSSTTDYARRYRQQSNFSTPNIRYGGSLTEQVTRDANNIINKILLNIPQLVMGGVKKIGVGLDKIFLNIPSKAANLITGQLGNIGKFLTSLIPDWMKTIVSGISDVISGGFSIVNNILGSVYSLVKGVLTEAFNRFMDMQKAIGGLSADIGLSKTESKQLLLNFTELSDTAMKFGGTMDDVVNQIKTFTDITGKNRLFDKSDVETLTELGLGTNLGVEGAAKLAAEFDNLGISINKVSITTNKARELGSKLGLNVGKILSQYQSLVTGLTGFQMKSGLDNMVKLATQATQLRMDLSQVSQRMSDSFFEPEGAVEAAAKMQVLGGQFAEKFGDAFELMYKAQNSPEEFAKDIMDATKGLAQKSTQGVFYIPPAQMKILKEAATGLGVDFEQMRDGAIEQAKLADKMNALTKSGVGGMFTDEDKNALSNLMRFDDKQKGYVIRNSKGVDTLLENLTDQNQFREIINQRKKDDESAQKRLNFQERISNIFNRFYNSFTQVFAQIFDKLEESGLMKELESFTNEMVKIIIPGIKGLFDPKGGLSTTMTDIFNGVTDIVKKITNIFSGQGSFWDKIKDGFFTLAKDIWTLISPYLKEGFGKLFEAIGGMMPSMLGGRTVEAKGIEMQMQAMVENKNIASMAGGQTGYNELLGKYEKNSGADTWGGGTNDNYEKYKKITMEPVNDALVTPSGRVLKGGKGDIGVLFDQASLKNNNSGGGQITEMKHSGTITVKSEDGKEITINDLEKIGRYTLATYFDSIKHGSNYGNAHYNNSKMPITPIK